MRGILPLIFILAACTSKLTVTTQKGPVSTALNGVSTMLVTSRRPVVVTPGDPVVLTGVGFRPTMTVALAGHNILGLADTEAVGVKVESDTRAVLAVPSDLATGPLQLSVGQDGAVQTISLLFDASASDIPIFTGAAGDVCSDHQFFDANGVLRTGTKLCTAEDATATCTHDGEAGCVVDGTTYKAAKLSNFDAAKILSGTTIAGVSGSMSVCGSDGTSACYVPAYVATAQPYKAVDYDNINTNKAKVRTSVTIAGLTGTLADCSSNGATDCVTTTSYKSADLTNLSAGNVRSGVEVAGQLGDYPSSTYPLTGADSTADLDLATFDAKIKSVASFEWFDSSGTRYTNTGDTDISMGNIANGVSIFGTSGSLISPLPCTGDGQSDCFVPLYDGTTNVFKSADTSTFSTWDIRTGKSVGGIPGSITFYKNMADTATFNRTTGTGALAGVDIYDTIDDNNDNGTFPTQNPSSWDQATGANWLRDPKSDTDANGACNGSENCVYKDQNSGLFWSQSDGTMRSWGVAINYCDGLNGSSFGGYASGWRLPTQKELFQGYVDGIWSQKDAARLNLMTNDYWSSSADSFSTTFEWNVYISSGTASGASKGSSFYVVCVR